MYPEIFVLISQWEVCQEGGSKRGYLEDIEWSWPEIWMTGSFLMSWMMFFYPKEDSLKILYWYLNQKSVRKGGSRRGVLGGCWGFLKGDIKDMVVSDIINDVFLLLGKYPENFVLISQWEVCQEGEIKKGGNWRTLRAPDQRQEGQSHPWPLLRYFEV